MALTKGEVSIKIIEGVMLTEDEFKLAKAELFYKPSLTYEDLKASYYEDDKRYGYICTRHETGITKDELGEMHCGFGLHIPDLVLKNLTHANLGLLVRVFGKDVIDRIPTKR